MLLTIDIGNTHITVGVFDGDEVAATFRLMTKKPRTADEYGMTICGLLERNEIQARQITDVIIASVVPNVMYSLRSTCVRYFHVEPIIVEAGIRTGIRVAVKNPRVVGADRIVDAAAAYSIYGGPVIVADFGTATTYDYIDRSGAFLSGVTAPGVQSSAEALWSLTAKLPEFEIVKPDSILAQDTTTSMQAGVFYGQIGATEYIINHMKDEIGEPDIKVVATGGLGRLISAQTDVIDIYDAMLTLKGMHLIYEKQDRIRNK